MSYPKKQNSFQGGTTASMNGSQYGGSAAPLGSAQSKDSKVQKRREQLHTLLVNKFRGKYAIDVDRDSAQDRIVRAEVARFLENEQMTEANLIKLDKRLGELLTGGNGSTVSRGASQAVLQDPYNTVDSRGSNRLIAGAKAQLGSAKPLSQASQRSRSSAIKDVGSQILGNAAVSPSALGNQSDDYWNKIILHNVEQFQKEKDAVKHKLRENQQKMKEELMKQMEDHKRAKQSEKRHDLEYFEEIRRQKEVLAREEKEKNDAIQQKINEQRIIRDQQILEHHRLKNAARKEKKDDYERLKKIEYDLKEQ